MILTDLALQKQKHMILCTLMGKVDYRKLEQTSLNNTEVFWVKDTLTEHR